MNKVYRVKDLIQDLLKVDQEAVVLYAHAEYGRTGIHGFINENLLVGISNADGSILSNDERDVVYSDLEDGAEFTEGINCINDEYHVEPAIILFAA